MNIRNFVLKALLVSVSVSAPLIFFELFLRVNSEWQRADSSGSVRIPLAQVTIPKNTTVPKELTDIARKRIDLLTMPSSWKRRDVQVEGASRAYYWHDVLHVYNSEGMRWRRPYPDKRSDHYRVLVVGDSLTYGYGISEQSRFSDLLNKWMGSSFRIEFLNLGHPGYQSEDILKVVKINIKKLKPDLVLYGVCLNDFLPSTVSEYYRDGSAYEVPLPPSLKKFLIENTRIGSFLSDRYDIALRKLHLRKDFFDDILANFSGYRTRFAQDVERMNKEVVLAGLPPMVAMVLDQFPGVDHKPGYGAKGHLIAMVAEEALSQAGAIVIPTEEYYRNHQGESMRVSRWEGHPNEAANYIWAQMIAKELNGRPDLKPYLR